LVGAWSWGKYVLITVIAVVVVGAVAFGSLMIYFNVKNMYTKI
jgi:Sec-independent protein translocase protein TatA